MISHSSAFWNSFAAVNVAVNGAWDIDKHRKTYTIRYDRNGFKNDFSLRKGAIYHGKVVRLLQFQRKR